jgi:type I restriction enzyme S subunit
MTLRPYPRYKPSGIDWLDHIPEHWDVLRGRYCMRVNPRSERIRAASLEEEVSFVPMEAVGGQGGLKLDATLAVAEGGTYTEFENGDVIVAKITPCFENGKGEVDPVCETAGAAC